MSEDMVASGPPVPPNGPSDWSDVVHANVFTNLQRLGLWIGKGQFIPNNSSPSNYIVPVVAGSLGKGATPAAIYVMAHGWAPGWRSVVDANNGKLLWWSKDATYNKRWASDWAWSPVGPPETPPLTVNPTGMAQQIYALDPTAIILFYSWIDDSATDDGNYNLQEVYESEAYTHLNGMRLASALKTAIAPSFFQNDGQLHLIGHSHGSRVATVAAMTLERMGIPATRLAILDSPETTSTLNANGANLLPFYLEQMKIQNPSYDCAAGIYVDCYASYFGMNYSSPDPNSPVNNVVEVALNPYPLYGSLDPGDSHTYAAGWYGGAAYGANSQSQPQVGLLWPPVPKAYTPAMNQNWSTASQSTQWLLQPGNSNIGSYEYDVFPMTVNKLHTEGRVTILPNASIEFQVGGSNPPKYSIYKGSFPADNTNQYGVAFDVEWTGMQAGDFFVVVTEGYTKYTLLVLDGSSPSGKTSVAVNCDIWGASTGNIYMYFYGTIDGLADIVTVSNFRYIEVNLPNGESLRTADAEVKEAVTN